MPPIAYRSRTQRDLDRSTASAQPPVRPPTSAHVDAAEARSVQFAASGGPSQEEDARPVAPPAYGREGHAFVAVGPGVPGSLLLAGRGGLMGDNPLPVQGAKIHRPLLRDDVLSRERLNGWLDKAVTGRLALIVAEAGFGKTTLLADWARHSQRLTAWYRLEPDDRDWLTFIRHLVASGRELDPDFAPDTFALLHQLGPGGPTQADLAANVVREFAAFSAGAQTGLTLIFDDYHVIDGSEDTDPIVRALLERTGPGFSVIIATRSVPGLPLGRLRARGGVSRLDGDALCFDVAETDRLFREAYQQPLEPDLVTDLISRTEGWAALLSLVRTNLEESKATNPRALIHQLSGSRGDLYDYVAEEVISTLPTDLQAFLTRASVLDEIAVETASAVDDRPRSEISALIRDAESRGLIVRPDPTSNHRFHPLIRRFLSARLRSEVGEAGARELHRAVAKAMEGKDWRAAASHYRASGDLTDAARVIDASVERILMAGKFDDVRGLLDGSAGSPTRPSALILRSRVELIRGSLETAIELARAAVHAEPSGMLAGLAQLNVAAILGVAGFPDGAAHAASQALTQDLTETQRLVAQATVSLWDSAHRGDLKAIAGGLRELATRQDREGHRRYASISRLNLATVLIWVGDARDALAVATLAEEGLRESGSSDVETVAAVAARATALAHLGRLADAHDALTALSSTPSVVARTEAMLELARIHGDFGDLEEATAALDRVGPSSPEFGYAGMWALAAGQIAIRRGDLEGAARCAAKLIETPCHDVAGELRGQLLKTRLALASGHPTAAEEAALLKQIAKEQRSRPGIQLADILLALSAGKRVGQEVAHLMPDDSAVLSLLAEELATNLHLMSDEALERISLECRRRPERWRTALRYALTRQPSMVRPAALLAEIGAPEDLGHLRALASTDKTYRAHAARLARVIAPPVVVSDLGAVEIRIGGKAPTRALRRKVLGLVCFLLTRTNLAATRDEALDALWPDLSPDTATNSLHQTIYFLRRVFEPDYREGSSAGYVVFDGDVVSLDGSLIDSSSRHCWRLVAESRASGLSTAEALLKTYSARFALDFAYEEWAANYRETLHAAVLGVAEQAIDQALAERDMERAIALAQAVLAVDPDADPIELALVRAYKSSGRRAAAAEQYAHYSTLMREQLGVEPPRWDDL